MTPICERSLLPLRERGESSSIIDRIMPLQGHGVFASTGVTPDCTKVWGIWAALQITWQNSPWLEINESLWYDSTGHLTSLVLG